MVRDGYFYALGMIVAAAVLWLTTHALWIAVLPLILAAFFLWFFRDPDRATPADPNLVISPADAAPGTRYTAPSASGSIQKRRRSNG